MQKLFMLIKIKKFLFADLYFSLAQFVFHFQLKIPVNFSQTFLSPLHKLKELKIKQKLLMIRLLLFPLHWIFVKKAFSHKRRLRESLDFLLQSIITSFRSWFCFLRRHVGCVYFFFVIMSVVFSFFFLLFFASQMPSFTEEQGPIGLCCEHKNTKVLVPFSQTKLSTNNLYFLW